MAIVTISDLEPRKLSLSLFPLFPHLFAMNWGPDAMILVYWMLSFKPTFSFSSFTFIKRLKKKISIALHWEKIICLCIYVLVRRHAWAFSSCCKGGLLSSCSAWVSRCSGFSACRAWTLGAWTSVVVVRRLSSCVAWAELLCGMWHLPRPGIELVSPPLAGFCSGSDG